MIEREIKNRVPTHPGRVLLAPVADMPNYFEIVRADEPLEEGTPLDKGTLDSIIKSRLTGRFYEPTVKQNTDSSYSGLTVSPIPTTNWVYDADNRYLARSGIFTVEVSSDSNTEGNRADDAFASSGWTSVGGLESWLKVYHSQALRVYKMSFAVEMQYTSRLTRLEIQGSTNGSTWQALGTYNNVTANTLTEYTLANIGDYNHYRLVFTSSGSNRITVKNFQYILYDVSMYANSYTLENVPVDWTRGQRITIYTPTVATLAVTGNTLNGIKINTILQSGKRYELRYNGASFDAKEV